MDDFRTIRDVVRSSFDFDYYRREYPDIAGRDDALLDHYCRTGWIEGRDPNADFDTTAYLLLNPDVAYAGYVPLHHYLSHGLAERRATLRAKTPSVATTRLTGRRVVDWVRRLRPYVDVDWYQTQLAAGELGAEADPVAHFAYRGWRGGLSPNAEFSTPMWLIRNHTAARHFVNPLLAELLRPGRASGAANDLPTADDVELVASELNTLFYIRNYPEAVELGLDAVAHFMTLGWRKGYDPHAAFATRRYVERYPEVGAWGGNPFLHFLKWGRDGAMEPKAPGGYLRAVVDDAQLRLAASSVAPRAPDATDLGNPDAVRRLLEPHRGGIVLSCSHDRYSRNVGGTQIVVDDEQNAFNRAGWRYLHISPFEPSLRLQPDRGAASVFVTIDGQELGAFDVELLGRILAPVGTPGCTKRIFALHSILGFSARSLIHLGRAFEPTESYAWVHDYSTICAGYNLLRNDVEFCGAPPADSMACRICAYGEARTDHAAAVGRLFAAFDITMVAPSQSAASLWRSATGDQTRRMLVQPHWHLREMEPDAPARARGKAVVLAFVGHSLASKGWPSFRSIVDDFADDPRYRLLHLAASRSGDIQGVTFVKTEVSRDRRFETIRLLRLHQADYVLVLSPWPETFCFVAHEAIVAGAQILCLAASGNVAALVRETGRGIVFDTMAALSAFLASDVAALAGRDLPSTAFAVESEAATATLVLNEAIISASAAA